jgi:hypothetical protein
LSSSSFSVFLFLFLFVHHESRPSFLITLPPYAAGTLGRLLSRNRATSSGDGERLLEAASPYTERHRPRPARVYSMGQKNPLSFMRISLVLEVRSCWPEFMVVSTFKVLQVSGQYKKYASVQWVSGREGSLLFHKTGFKILQKQNGRPCSIQNIAMSTTNNLSNSI